MTSVIITVRCCIIVLRRLWNSNCVITGLIAHHCALICVVKRWQGTIQLMTLFFMLRERECRRTSPYENSDLWWDWTYRFSYGQNAQWNGKGICLIPIPWTLFLPHSLCYRSDDSLCRGGRQASEFFTCAGGWQYSCPERTWLVAAVRRPCRTGLELGEEKRFLNRHYLKVSCQLFFCHHAEMRRFCVDDMLRGTGDNRNDGWKAGKDYNFFKIDLC